MRRSSSGYVAQALPQLARKVETGTEFMDLFAQPGQSGQ
jgi:hypothetical protein